MTAHKSLVDVYATGLGELHSAEILVGEALPAIVSAVADPQLREMFVETAAQTRQRIDSIARILQRLGRDMGGSESPVMAALLDNVRTVIRDAGDVRIYAPADMRIRDAALIVGWRKVEHHRIAGYACASALAEVGDDDEDAEVLRDYLRETREDDADLADLADSIINVQAPW